MKYVLRVEDDQNEIIKSMSETIINLINENKISAPISKSFELITPSVKRDFVLIINKHNCSLKIDGIDNICLPNIDSISFDSLLSILYDLDNRID
jgi:hypothetical protein